MLLMMRIAFHADADKFREALSALGSAADDKDSIDKRWTALKTMKRG